MFERVNIRTGALTDGRRLKSNPIGSAREPSAQVSLKCGTRGFGKY